MKKILFFNLILVLLTVILVTPNKPKACSAADVNHANIISVTGSASVYAVCDEVVLSFGVHTTDALPSKASSENADIMKNVYDVLNDYVISQNNIMTVSYNIYPNYQYSDAKTFINGYTVQHDLKIKLKDVSAAGKLIDDLTSAGVNHINGLQFLKGDSQEDYKQALQNALDDAYAKAGVIAGKINKQIQLIKLTEESYSGGLYKENFMRYDAAVSGATKLASGQIHITAHLKCDFEMI